MQRKTVVQYIESEGASHGSKTIQAKRRSIRHRDILL